MEGAARGLFVPLSLSVGFAMLASYILSSTFVPVAAAWLLKQHHAGHGQGEPRLTLFDRLRSGYEAVLSRFVQFRIAIIVLYLVTACAVIVLVGTRLGREIFPVVDATQFRLRIRAPDGTHIGSSEETALRVLELINDEVGAGNVHRTLGYVGMIHSNFPVNAVYQWSRGPEETILYVELDEKSGLSAEQLKQRLRERLAREMPETRFSFEPSDIVNEVMSFGSPTPVEVAISGPDFAASREYAEKVRQELAKITTLRDLQFAQSLDYPTVRVEVNRERAGLAGLTPTDVARSLVTATSSSRFVVPNYWADPKSGIAYQVQVEVPRSVVRSPYGVDTANSASDLERIPLRKTADGQVLLRDVAEVQPGTMPGQFDRYNMRRQVSLTANVTGTDLGSVSNDVAAALKRAGEPPRGAQVDVRGQISPMRQMLGGLSIGLGLAVVAVFLLLTANFQSLRLALVTVSTAPAVIAGVVLLLWLTGTTLNIQSFIGSIMAIGVAMANAILLVTFAETRRREGLTARDAAVAGAGSRLRAILMTSCAMVAGMLPMALALGEAGQQNAPLGRAVIGGLVAATIATLLVLPSMFALLQSRASIASPSLDAGDPESARYAP
jgi:multidrug efflux pump subunit AcrB